MTYDFFTSTLNFLTQNPSVTLFSGLIVGYIGARKEFHLGTKYKTEAKGNELFLRLYREDKERTDAVNGVIEEDIGRKRGYYGELTTQTAKNLVSTPNLLFRWLEQTDLTLGGSIYGDRIDHFYYEKAALAKLVLDEFNKLLLENNKTKYCLLIDSGTTMYHIFCEIAERLKKVKYREMWEERVFIVTNNLPGIQYLMNNYEDKIKDKHSPFPINCLILPGKPLPVYSAATGKETCEFLKDRPNLDKIVDLNLKTGNDHKVISFLTASYIARQSSNNNQKNKKTYSCCLLARGGGHGEVKEKFAELSDSVYIISPLTKFSFATLNCFNELSEFTIDESEKEKAEKYPGNVKYKEVKINDDNCIFFTTKRTETDRFYNFSSALIARLQESYRPENVKIANDYILSQWLPKKSESLKTIAKESYWKEFLVNRNERNENKNIEKYELEMEIPHKNLRDHYIEWKKKKQYFIWDELWITEPTKECEKFN